jgi:hypothetical protein
MFPFKRNRYADVAFLAVFFVLTLLVGFIHTEKTVEGGQACPACRYMSSSIATQAVPIMFVPQIDVLNVVEVCLVLRYELLLSVDRSPRGPPLA